MLALIQEVLPGRTRKPLPCATTYINMRSLTAFGCTGKLECRILSKTRQAIGISMGTNSVDRPTTSPHLRNKHTRQSIRPTTANLELRPVQVAQVQSQWLQQHHLECSGSRQYQQRPMPWASRRPQRCPSLPSPTSRHRSPHPLFTPGGSISHCRAPQSRTVTPVPASDL